MTQHIQIFVPSTINTDKVADLNLICGVQDAIKRSFSANFGGFTAYNAQGGYVANNGMLVCEPVQVITSVTDDSVSEQVLWAYIKRIGKAVCQKMSQECVLVSVNGNVEFVS